MITSRPTDGQKQTNKIGVWVCMSATCVGEAFVGQKHPPNMHVMVLRGDNGPRGCCERVERPQCRSVTAARHQKPGYCESHSHCARRQLVHGRCLDLVLPSRKDDISRSLDTAREK